MSDALAGGSGGDALDGGRRAKWRWGPLARSSVRIGVGVACLALGIGLGYVDYLVLGPAWIHGQLAIRRDLATGAAVRDVVSGHGHVRWALFADGSSVSLDWESWVRYPLAFAGSERVVSLEGQGVFVVKRDSVPFVLRTDPIVVRTDAMDEAEFAVWGYWPHAACAIEVRRGRVTVIETGSRATRVAAPSVWRRGTCPFFDQYRQRVQRATTVPTVQK